MKLSALFFTNAVFAASSFARSLRRIDVRDKPVVRDGATLLLAGESWKAVGPNVYWLGLDENVIPPAGQPFYAPFNASYPTKERITEVMATVKALGGTMVRAHTLGVSTGNPLSLMPEPGQINEKAFETIDWAVYQAREYGLRLLVPLTDNFVRCASLEHPTLAQTKTMHRTITTVESITSSDGPGSISHRVKTRPIL